MKNLIDGNINFFMKLKIIVFGLGNMNKKKVLADLQTLGLLHLATALTCIILATRGENLCPRHPSLPQFLIIAGALIFGFGIHSKVNKFVVIYGLPDDRPFTRNENQVIYLLSYYVL